MKILLIEDEQEIASFVKKGLEKEMYLVEIEKDGEEGSFKARTSSYDLIILDYVLPKLNGNLVLKEIREDNNHTPVLFLTIKKELNFKKECFEMGADDYLPKPFLLDELIFRVKALLNRPKKIKENVLKIDNLILDCVSGTVKRENKELYLTKKEFSLLEFFFLNRDRIVSRSQILENVWDYNADPFSNSIETHIASLRKKLKPRRLAKNKSRELIHTFSGRGYKMSVNKY
ncbi:MAG: response regulator transcription factor [Patescibacteria group bacterium]|jgi:two-component system copper resistance phosphate regulon response regulator CusR|nr:response regulator transcription factor [Patescibacteria group bacterium]